MIGEGNSEEGVEFKNRERRREATEKRRRISSSRKKRREPYACQGRPQEKKDGNF